MNLNNYRDNNNFVMVNRAHINKNIYLGSAFRKDRTFYSVIVSPPWIGQSIKTDLLVSRDEGKNFEIETVQMLFGSYYFLSENMIVLNYTSFTTIDLLSDIGGLFEIFYMTLWIFLAPFNNTKFFNKAIRAVYF